MGSYVMDVPPTMEKEEPTKEQPDVINMTPPVSTKEKEEPVTLEPVAKYNATPVSIQKKAEPTKEQDNITVSYVMDVPPTMEKEEPTKEKEEPMKGRDNITVSYMTSPVSTKEKRRASNVGACYK